MDKGKRQHLQDIYASDNANRDDFTPQVSAEIIEERKRDVRRHQFTGFMLGLVVLVLSVSLIYVVVREYVDIHSMAAAPTPITQEYIPRYSLPSESQWVLDFPRDYGNPKWDGEGERPFSSDWVKKAAFNLILAEQASGIGENANAAQYYENVLEILPNLTDVKVPLGMIYFKMNEFDKALTLLENTPKSDLTPEILNNLGAACISAKAYDRAETYLKQSIEMKATYAEAQKNLALLYKAQKKDDAAVAAFEKYIDLRPTDIDTQHSLALYLTKIGRWEQAAKLLDQLTQQITDVPVLYLLQAQVETHNNRLDKAMNALKRYVQLSDPGAALAYMDIAEFEQLRGSDEFQSMIKALEKPKK